MNTHLCFKSTTSISARPISLSSMQSLIEFLLVTFVWSEVCLSLDLFLSFSCRCFPRGLTWDSFAKEGFSDIWSIVRLLQYMLDNERTGLAFRLWKRTLVAPHAARRNGYATETVVFACNHGRKSLMASSRTTRSRLCRHRRRYILAKLCALIVCAAFLCLWNVRAREARFRLQNADLHEMIKHSNQNHDQHPLSRCVDADDNRSSLVTCSCPDPLTETADSN